MKIAIIGAMEEEVTILRDKLADLSRKQLLDLSLIWGHSMV